MKDDSKYYIKKEKIELSRERPAKVTFCGSTIFIEVNTSKEYQSEKDIRLDKSHLLEKATMSIRKANVTTEYQKNKSNLRVAAKKAKKLILTNFNNNDSWTITLTYSSENYDEALVNSRIKYFFKKFKKVFATEDLVYIYFPEHQRYKRKELNAFVMHYHIILKSKDNNDMKLSFESLKEIWPYGSIKFKKVYDIYGLSNYVCGHLSHTSLKFINKAEQKSHLKKYGKTYICSKNIERPTSFVMALDKAYDIVHKLNCKQIEYYSCSFYMHDEDSEEDKFINHYRKCVYRIE